MDGNPIPSRTLHVRAWNAVAVMTFQLPESAARTQKRCLREGGLKFCGQYKEPCKFHERLDLISQCLTYFPMCLHPDGTMAHPSVLPTEEKIEVLDKARTNQIQKLMLTSRDSSRKHTRASSHARALQEWCDNVLLAQALEARNSTSSRKRAGGENDDGGRPRKKEMQK